MKHSIEKTLLMGLIIELCAGEDEIDLLDLIYRILMTNHLDKVSAEE